MLFNNNINFVPAKKIRAGGKGGNSQLCRIQGIITSKGDTTVKGPKGQEIQKVMLTVFPNKIISNGAPDVVITGVPGQNYLFPSRPLDTPEAAESNGGYQSKERELVCEVDGLLRRVSSFTASFYKETADGKAATASACEVGMQVEISGVCAQYGKPRSDGTVGLFLNGGRPTPASDTAPSSRNLPKVFKAFASQPEMQLQAAFATSVAVHGFFSASELNPAQQEQVEICKSMWATVTEATADRLVTMQSGKSEQIAEILGIHERRVRSTSPAALASQQQILFRTDPAGYDCDIAPIVITGLSPSKRTPGQISDLMEPGPRRDALPETFVACWVGPNIDWLKDTGFNLEICAAFVWNSKLAAEALDAGEYNPIVASSGTAIAMTQSMKDWAAKIGTPDKAKLQMGINNLIKSAEMTFFGKTFSPLGGVGGELPCTFPLGSIYVNMPETLQKAAVIVPHEFIKTVMCEGNSQYVPDEVEGLQQVEANGAMPVFLSADYQELTQNGKGFKFSNLVPRSGMKLEFRVVYEGSHENIGKDPTIASVPQKGQEHIEEAAAAVGEGSIKDFLSGSCLIYAVAVKD